MRAKNAPPVMIKWPEQIEPKMDITHVASNIDLSPTILSIAGLKKDAMMTGLDLTDEAAVKAREYVFGDNYHHDMKDPEDKSASLRARVAISNQWKLIRWEDK